MGEHTVTVEMDTLDCEFHKFIDVTIDRDAVGMNLMNNVERTYAV